MSYFEFPHTRTYDSDLGWLITEYKRIAEELAALTLRVAQNEADIADIKADLIRIRQELEDFKAQIIRMFNELEAELRAQLEEFQAQIEEELRIMEANILRRFEVLQQRVDDTLELFREELTRTEEELRAELASAIAEMNYQLETTIADIRAQFEALEANIERTLALYDEKIADNLIASKAYTDEREAYLQEEIDNIRIDPTTRVIIPATQAEATLQDTFDTEHYYLRSWALRASYYDSLGLTATEYDELNLIAYDYDYLAKWFVVEKHDVAYMISPINGNYETTKEVMIELSDLLRDIMVGAFTATEYDALEISAEDYDALLVSAFNYDYFGKNYVA